MQAAELDPWLAWVAKAGKGFAAVLSASLEHHVDHAVQLVLPAEHASSSTGGVAGGLLGTARVHAVLVPHIHHALLDVLLAVQAPCFACRAKYNTRFTNLLPGTRCIHQPGQQQGSPGWLKLACLGQSGYMHLCRLTTFTIPSVLCGRQ